MLDTLGFVAEGSGENLFVVRDGVVRTPGAHSILPGITRDTAMRILADGGLEVREEMITRDDLYIADEIFLTGTAVEVTPVREVDRRQIGDGRPGPVTQGLQKKYDEVVRGGDPKYRPWLSQL